MCHGGSVIVSVNACVIISLNAPESVSVSACQCNCVSGPVIVVSFTNSSN